jgi:hypothetical protein
MDKERAKQINEKVFDLIELCLRYESQYGGGQPRHESTEDAWQAAQVIEDKQSEILDLFDIEALKQGPKGIKGLPTFGYFMDSKLASELAMAITHLVIYCIQAELGQPTAEAIITQQRFAISMIDPKAFRESMKNRNEDTKS